MSTTAYPSVPTDPAVAAVRARNGGARELTDAAISELLSRFPTDTAAQDAVCLYARICVRGGVLKDHDQVRTLQAQAQPVNADELTATLHRVQDAVIAKRAVQLEDAQEAVGYY